jgi:Ca2+:H+ antiporter
MARFQNRGAYTNMRNIAYGVTGLLTIANAVVELINDPLDLVFTPLELVSLGAAVVVTAFIALDGEPNWFERAMLCGVCVIAALTFFFSA